MRFAVTVWTRLVNLMLVSTAIGLSPAHADRKWEQSSSPGLTVISDDKNSAQAMEGLIEEAHALAEMGLPVYGKRPIVFIVTNDSTFVSRAWPQGADINAEGLGGITYGFPDTIYVVVDRGKRNSDYALRHELVHALLRRSALQIPLWIDEGLADNLSSYRIDEGKISLGQIGSRHRWRQGSCSTETPFSEVLERDYRTAGYANGGGAVVHISDLVVRYLIDHDSLPKVLLFLASSSASQKEALRTVLGMDPQQLNDEAIRYCKAGFAPNGVTNHGAAAVAHTTRPIAPEGVQSLFMEMLSRVPGRAQEVVDFYRKELALYPEDLSATRGLGIALVYQNDYSQALNFLDRTGHFFDSDSTALYHRLIACQNTPNCSDATSKSISARLASLRPDLVDLSQSPPSSAQEDDDGGFLMGDSPGEVGHTRLNAEHAEVGLGSTPETVAFGLIQDIKKSTQQWQMRSPGFDEIPKDRNYTLNGKRISGKESTAARREYIMRDCAVDQFEVIPVGPFPTRMIVTYRMQSTLYSQKTEKTQIFSVFVKDTYDFLNSQWKETKLEALTAK